MTLPSPGSSISFSQINTEWNLSSTASGSLNDRAISGNMASATSTSETSMSGKFGGVTHAEVAQSYGSVTIITNNLPDYVAYRTINMTGRVSGNTFKPIVRCALSSYTDGGGSYEYSINSTSTWTIFKSWNGTFSATNYTLGTIDYNDIFRIRIQTSHAPYSSNGGSIQIYGGIYVIGAGSFSGTSTWSWSHL